MAKHLGARVFGTVSTDDKARLVRELGADETINYTTQDFETEVKRLTTGRGVDVVYDSVGKTTFDKSLAVLRPRGMLALFGQSSGSVPPFDPGDPQRAGFAVSHPPQPGHHLLNVMNCCGGSATSSAMLCRAPSRCGFQGRTRWRRPPPLTKSSRVADAGKLLLRWLGARVNNRRHGQRFLRAGCASSNRRERAAPAGRGAASLVAEVEGDQLRRGLAVARMG